MLNADVPLAIPFLLFTLAFLLIGISPAWKRTFMRLRNYVSPVDKSSQDLSAPPELNEIEFIILQRLARARSKMISSKHLTRELHLNRKLVEQALNELFNRGLVRFSRLNLINKSYTLTTRGANYAIELGFIPNIRKQTMKS